MAEGVKVSSQRHSAVSATYLFSLGSDSRSGMTGANPIDDVSRRTVLIADKDNHSLRDLRVALTQIGFDVGEASTMDEITRRLRMIEYDSVLVNINLGIEAIRCIRANYSRIPILAFAKTANDDVQLSAFDTGADDFIVKAFKLLLLAARLRSSIRRYHAIELPVDRTLTVKDVTLDPIRRKVEKKGTLVHLRPKEVRMLQFLNGECRKTGESRSHIRSSLGRKAGWESRLVACSRP